MYILLGILLFLCVLFFLINYRRRKRIIRKICGMSRQEKQNRLNVLIRPFGFLYDSCEDIFLSSVDAWQREFGYRALFDRAAPGFQMVFDCEPIYFDYDGRTWLIEFWKGQYGINTGAEIGIYYADRILLPQEYSFARFHSVSDGQMLPMSMTLASCGHPLFHMENLHWWLAGFRMGTFSRPSDLSAHISLTFPDRTIMESFIRSLQKSGYNVKVSCDCGLAVSFSFAEPTFRQAGLFYHFRCQMAQLKNQLFVRFFCWITRPFSCTEDRLLYLYDFLPFAFRRTVSLRRSCCKRHGFKSRSRKGHCGGHAS
ncbi:MAG: DUF4474 domain-containing protein [Eubacteriales bacterium]|nr:DUF4474 domain-containing protein [Eubacteriales bacterium]